MRKKIDLSDLKVGDKAWSAIFGSGVIDDKNSEYVGVDFSGENRYFYLSGNLYQRDVYPTLFHSEQEFREYWGMESNTLTKREQFAMAAMQGLLANQYSRSTSCEFKVETAIEHADALITKLNETK
jgi:hypothetical protein